MSDAEFCPVLYGISGLNVHPSVRWQDVNLANVRCKSCDILMENAGAFF